MSRLIFVIGGVIFLIVLLMKLHELGLSVSQRDAIFYYGVSAALFCAAVVCAFLPRLARTYILIIGATVGVTAVSADVYFGVTQKSFREIKQDRFRAEWIKHNVPYDNRTLLNVVDDIRKDGTMAYPKLNPATVVKTFNGTKAISQVRVGQRELVPLGTISRMTSVYCNESGRYLVYKSDRHGFHNPRHVWNSGNLAVAAVGDSFTEGSCVPSDRNFVSLLRKLYPATLNLGMGGNGPLMELAALTEYLTRKRPRVVLWVYCEANDLWDLEENRASALLMKYLEPGFSQDLLSRQPQIDQAIRSFEELFGS